MIVKVIESLRQLKSELLNIEEQRKAKLELFNEYISKIQKEIKNSSTEIYEVMLYISGIKGRADILTIILTTKEVMIISYKIQKYRVELPNHEDVITKGQISKYEQIYKSAMDILFLHNLVIGSDNEVLEVDFEEVPVYNKRDMNYFRTSKQVTELKKEYYNLKIPKKAITRPSLIVFISEKLNITMEVVVNLLNI